MFQFSRLQRHPAALFAAVLLSLLLGFGFYFERLAAEPRAALPMEVGTPLLAGWASPQVRQFVRWAVDSRDHRGLPFVVIDKAQARLFAFDGTGHLLASTPVLLGAARSDAADAPATPAGRFVADPRQPSQSASLVWFDGETELRLHAPASPLAPGRAAQRLASDKPDDKRISDGSLHVPDAFYWQHLVPLRGRASVAYVLPEQRPLPQLFEQRRELVARGR